MDSSCSILINGERTINDIHLSLPHNAFAYAIPDKACFRLLSVVETARVPLHLILGSPFSIHTSSVDTERWFHDLLLQDLPSDGEQSSFPWWRTARHDSSLGILVAVPESSDASISCSPRVTELLFYASRCGQSDEQPGSSCCSLLQAKDLERLTTLDVCAVAISSGLLHQAQSEPTPPPSPTATDAEISAKFLPHRVQPHAQIINEPPVRKRKSAADVFEEASERRKKARRKGGVGVSATAATKVDSQTGSLHHRHGHNVSQPTLLSRSPSASSSRPPTAVQNGSRGSALSRVQSVSAIVDTSDLETKNKNLISRIVMAGMRLYGLSQSKARRSRANSSAPSPVVDASFEDLDAERTNDEEFKLIYHQAFKGTCFAFRAVIAEQTLQTSSDAIRDTADKLLAIFCNGILDSRGRSKTTDIASIGSETFVSM